MSDIFVTEIGGAGRWQQASVTFKFVKAYFGGPPENVSSVTLHTHNGKGELLSSHTQHAMFKPASSNWAFELPGLDGVDYPGKAARPIAVFRRMPSGGFAHEVLMPGDTGYALVDQLLAVKNKERKGRLRRSIMALPDLAAVWPNSPVVKAIG